MVAIYIYSNSTSYMHTRHISLIARCEVTSSEAVKRSHHFRRNPLAGNALLAPELSLESPMWLAMV